MKQETLYAIAKSWGTTGGEANATEDILAWVSARNESVAVDIQKSTLSSSTTWFYDKDLGTIHNQNHSFFSISGFEKRNADGSVVRQPIILQQEIGFRIYSVFILFTGL